VIASLRGTILARGKGKIVLEVGGVGYEIYVTDATLAGLPDGQACLQISESIGLYGGGQTLYGFLAPGEKALFEAFRDCVPSTGAKKALDYLEKASKSLPDFRRAILEKDSRILCGVFGFTPKTAEKLVEALKERLEEIPSTGPERLGSSHQVQASHLSQALSALSALGYKPAEARAALQAAAEDAAGQELGVEQILRLALKRL